MTPMTKEQIAQYNELDNKLVRRKGLLSSEWTQMVELRTAFLISRGEDPNAWNKRGYVMTRKSTHGDVESKI